MVFSRRWLLLFALGLVPLLLTGISHGYLGLALAWDGLLLALALTDWLLFPPLEQLYVEREVEDKLSLGAPNPVRVRVRNTSDVDLSLELRDSPPEAIPNDLPGTPLLLTAGAGRRQAILYHLTPQARGDYTFGDIYLRVRGRLGLVSRQVRVPARAAVKVYPNLLETAKFNLMARRGRLQQLGIRAARLQGAGREFESLRDYQPDDELRRIDWKATARRGKFISRQYEVERSQNVILVLDVGRTMLAEIDGIQKLDYAINAALLLAYVATLSEDKVGLLVFADTVQTYLPPKKGRAQVYAILEALYNAKATLAEPDYRGALAYLSTRWRKRSLMVCFTDLWDPDSSRQTIAELAGLQPRHLVAAVTLLDTKVLRAAAQEADAAQAIYEKAVATQVLEDRQKATGALAQRGVLVVDAPADKLSAELVNRYLEVKERMLL
ncbi:MAG TPA: DUF58 domain-containing protein [Chthonomonadaceae bacterium]|nr:DUF58 domain-containing protein [Chthonomonadaceae bacterium]